MNKTLNSKRVFAYLLDIAIVLILTTLISDINFLNPYKEKYSKAISEYTEYYEENYSDTNNKTADELLTDEYFDLTYKVQKYSMYDIIIETVVIILYFSLFPLFNDGKTIGKQILKIKLVNNKGDNLKWYQYILRSLIVPMCSSFILFNPISELLSILGLIILRGKEYYYFYFAVVIIVNVLGYADIIYMLKKNQALHDKLLKTEVKEV